MQSTIGHVASRQENTSRWEVGTRFTSHRTERVSLTEKALRKGHTARRERPETGIDVWGEGKVCEGGRPCGCVSDHRCLFFLSS